MKLKYKVEVVHDYSFSEIDFDLYDDMFGELWKTDDYPDIDSDDDSMLDSYPISIDLMIQALYKLKESGANYVNIDYHCDHIGYNMEGLKITKIEEE